MQRFGACHYLVQRSRVISWHEQRFTFMTDINYADISSLSSTTVHHITMSITTSCASAPGSCMPCGPCLSFCKSDDATSRDGSARAVGSMAPAGVPRHYLKLRLGLPCRRLPSRSRWECNRARPRLGWGGVADADASLR